jgi:hypothetical protein
LLLLVSCLVCSSTVKMEAILWNIGYYPNYTTLYSYHTENLRSRICILLSVIISFDLPTHTWKETIPYLIVVWCEKSLILVSEN